MTTINSRNIAVQSTKKVEKNQKKIRPIYVVNLMTRTGRPISLQLGGDRIYPNNDRRRRPYPSTRRLPVGSRLNAIRIIYGRVFIRRFVDCISSSSARPSSLDSVRTGTRTERAKIRIQTRHVLFILLRHIVSLVRILGLQINRYYCRRERNFIGWAHYSV